MDSNTYDEHVLRVEQELTELIARIDDHRHMLSEADPVVCMMAIGMSERGRELMSDAWRITTRALTAGTQCPPSCALVTAMWMQHMRGRLPFDPPPAKKPAHRPAGSKRKRDIARELAAVIEAGRQEASRAQLRGGLSPHQAVAGQYGFSSRTLTRLKAEYGPRIEAMRKRLGDLGHWWTPEK